MNGPVYVGLAFRKFLMHIEAAYRCAVFSNVSLQGAGG